MPLYLDEIYVNASSPDNVKKFVVLFQEVIKGGLPQGVTLKAGPWASNEEFKILVILDIQDHSATFNAFIKILSEGLVIKRKLTPIVEWDEVETMARDLRVLPPEPWPIAGPKNPGPPPQPQPEGQSESGNRDG